MGRRYNSETYRRWYERNRDKKLKQRKDYYEKNREQQLDAAKKRYKEIMADPELHRKKNAANRAWKRRVKIEIIRRYGGKCICCGENRIEFLCIHHIDNDGAKHRQKLHISAGYSFYAWLKRNNYPEGFKVLCANCNTALGYYGYCPHKTKTSFLKSKRGIFIEGE